MNARQKPSLGRGLLPPLVVGATAVLALNLTAIDANDAWPWSAYDVSIAVVADDHPALTSALVAALKECVARRLHETVGIAWNITFPDLPKAVMQPWPGEMTGLIAEQISEPALLQGDKFFIVALTTDGAHYEIQVREWDPALRSLGPLVESRSEDRLVLSEITYEAILEAFRPTAHIVDVLQSHAELRIRGSMLFPPDAWCHILRPGDGFTPWLRLRRRDGEIADTKPIPWTFLKVEEIVADTGREPRVRCDIQSGLRSPLASRQRGRNEQWALATGRPRSGTWLTIASQAAGRRLADCEAFSIDSDRNTVSLGRTDEEGRLFVPSSNGRLQTLVVTSRFLPLAKFPMLPGLSQEVSVPVPADERLRTAEDWLADWQAEFLDLYIRRRALMSSASVRIERQELPQAQELLDQVDRLGSPSDKIGALEVRRRAISVGNAMESRLVDQLFAEAIQTVTALDDGATLVELRNRLRQAMQRGT